MYELQQSLVFNIEELTKLYRLVFLFNVGPKRQLLLKYIFPASLAHTSQKPEMFKGCIGECFIDYHRKP